MLDFATRRFTIRLGRANKSALANGERVKRRTSVVGRKPSARRVSVRNSAAVRRAPSGAGVHRRTSVRRSQSAVRRGASVKRAPSTVRRNSKRMSTYGDGIPPSSSIPLSSVQPAPPADLANPSLSDAPVVPIVTSSTSSKSFFSKLTSRFRGRSSATKAQMQFQSQSQPPVLPSLSTGLVVTLSTTNLSPLAPSRTPSVRSPSPGSRVTFVDTVEAEKVSNAGIDLDVPSSQEAADSLLAPAPLQDSPKQADLTLPLVDITDEDSGADDEWVDAEDDEGSAEPRGTAAPLVDIIDPAHANSGVDQKDVPECTSGEASAAKLGSSGDFSVTQSENAQLQVEVLNDLDRESVGVDVRVSQWLAVTPVVVVGEEQTSTSDGRVRSLEGIIEGVGIQDGATAPTKAESKRPRPPHIVVPNAGSKLSSNSPFRVPLPPSPSPSNLSPLPETNPFGSSQPGFLVEPSSTNELFPPLSPSILLTPAEATFDLTRTSDEGLTVDSTQVPLPPSPSPSYASPVSQHDDDHFTASPTNSATVARAGSISTSGRRSLSTTPSSRGPTTPTSIRVPGHPAFAHFSFGGPTSPSFKVEDWEDGEEERRGRSLEVKDGKRRMRSVSPQLDAVLEGDESRRSSRASFEGTEVAASGEAKPVLSLLPAVEEVVTFGRRNSDDTDSDVEDEAGFFAFAERQLVEEQKRAAEAQQLAVPKRSKTMSFLSAGFGKRKSTAGDLSESAPANSVSRSATSSRLGVPTTGPKRSSTLVAPSSSGNRMSRLVPGQRSSTLLAEPLSPRTALSPTMYSVGDIQAATGKIEDEESRRLSEAVFMF